MYWEYISEEDFKKEYSATNVPYWNRGRKEMRQFCSEGNFHYDFEDSHYYYKFAGKTRKMIHRFPKGFESMGNRALFEKTPSEKVKKLSTKTVPFFYSS
jgi:hypothetical protein